MPASMFTGRWRMGSFARSGLCHSARAIYQRRHLRSLASGSVTPPGFSVLHMLRQVRGTAFCQITNTGDWSADMSSSARMLSNVYLYAEPDSGAPLSARICFHYVFEETCGAPTSFPAGGVGNFVCPELPDPRTKG